MHCENKRSDFLKLTTKLIPEVFFIFNELLRNFIDLALCETLLYEKQREHTKYSWRRLATQKFKSIRQTFCFSRWVYACFDIIVTTYKHGADSPKTLPRLQWNESEQSTPLPLSHPNTSIFYKVCETFVFQETKTKLSSVCTAQKVLTLSR